MTTERYSDYSDSHVQDACGRLMAARESGSYKAVCTAYDDFIDQLHRIVYDDDD